MTETQNPLMTEERRTKLLEWADALESGKYKQGRMYLQGVNGEYCCLGVLCSINEINVLYGYQTLDQIKNEEFLKLVGLDDNGRLTSQGIALLRGLFPDKPPWCKNVGLTLLNDEYGFSFKEIAQLIRAAVNHPEECFIQP